MLRRQVCSAAVIGLLVGTFESPAQTTTAELSGIVMDESGAVVPGVAVKLKQETTGAVRITHTDERGAYYVPQLPPGPYRITTEFPGFQTDVRQGVLLTVGRHAVVSFVLKVGAIDTQTVVNGDAFLVDTRITALSWLMDNRSIKELPLNGRDLAQLALLEPGVVPSRRTSDSGGPGIKLVIGGGRPSQVSFLVDGSDINDANNNTPGSVAGVLLGVDSLQEFRVWTNANDASYGRSAGGIVSAVTRAGTNKYHGSMFHFLRNSALDARNFFDAAGQAIPPFKRNQFGATFEGPIWHDRTFFLGSFEGLRQRLGLTSRSVVPTPEARTGVIPNQPLVRVDPVVVPYLGLLPLPNDRNFGDGTGEYVSSASQETDENFATGRLDHRFSDATSLFGRYTYDAAAVRAPDALKLVRADSTSRNQFFTTQLTRIFSDRALNNFRFSFNRSFSNSEPFFLRTVGPSLSFLPGSPLGQISVTGLFSLGPSRFGPSRSLQDLLQWSDDVTLRRGRHSIRIGADHRWIMLETIRPQSPYGFYQFNGLTDFLKARASAVELTLPSSTLEHNWRQSHTSAYIQDDVQLSRRLTLNLGVRYERISVPIERDGLVANLRDWLHDTAPTVGDPLFVNPSNLDFAPRVGFALDPAGDGRTSVRAGFGLFHDLLWTDFYGNAANRNPPFYTLGSIRNPVFPRADSLIGNPNFVLGRLDAFQYRPENPYSMQYNFTVQREVAREAVLTVSYAGQRGLHLPRFIDANQLLMPTRHCRRFCPTDGSSFRPTRSYATRISRASATR